MPDQVSGVPADATDAEGRRIVLPAHAKTNLLLRVLGPTGDGYHQLETVFVRLGLHDEVELELDAAGPSSGLQVSVDEERRWPGREPTPEGPENLCWGAAELFFDAVGRDPSVAVRLRKRIPPASGLAGGSADAAAVLRGLNGLDGARLAEERLLELAGELGSDVPFCLTGSPMVLGWERGRRLLPLPALPPRPVLVLVPPVAVGTSDAYRWLDERRSGIGWRSAAGRLPPPDLLARWSRVDAWAANDFEPVVIDHLPDVAEAVAWLREGGARPVHLSGSGSAVVGYFREASTRDAALEAAGDLDGVLALATEAPFGSG